MGFYDIFTCVLVTVLFSHVGFLRAEPIECPIPGNPTTITEEDCTASACEFDGTYCHMKSNEIAGYYVAGDKEPTSRGFKVNIAKSSSNSTLFGDDIENLYLEVLNHEEYHLQIKIYDDLNQRYEVPFPVETPLVPSSETLYNVSISETGEPLKITVYREATSTAVFETVGPLSYENQFLQFTVKLPSDYLYGLGENYHTSLRHNFTTRSTYPIFTRDRYTANPGERNHYGAHPYYIAVEDDSGNSHSVLLYNSNAIEYSTFLMDDGSPAITLRSIGGVIDLHLFLGPTPEDVNAQYANAVGRASLPPYWSLGFILSRLHYGSSDNYRIVRQRMKDENIPMDVQTFDVDYMDGSRDFTYDPVNYPDFPELVEELHQDGVKVMISVDPALAMEFDTYPPAQRGKEADVYIHWASPDLVPDDQPEAADTYFLGRVWPENRTVFPDFLKPETTDWWKNEMEIFHEAVKFDSIWLDMNEPSNLETKTCPDTPFDAPPYPTKASGELNTKTICISTNQTDGTTNYNHYDVHSLYGHSEVIATHNSLQDLFPGLRKLILSRSSFPGTGHYAAHWLGDNSANWGQMELSVIGLIEFNMFAIPFVGADICGFLETATMELCARWMELGAFYPYSRNHNSKFAEDHDPAVWPEVAAISREVLGIRYKYLPVLNNLFHRASSEGNSVVRPLFNVFPQDMYARDVQDQFFWGDTIMVAPVMVESATSRSVYFPQGLWYRIDYGHLISSGAETLEIEAPLEYIPVYIRGGKILPFQYPGVTTVESRNNSFGFTVALDEGGAAGGELFWDDGVSEILSSDAFFASLTFQQNTFSTEIIRNPDVAEGILVSSLDFYGVSSEPSSVTVNGAVESVVWNYESEFGVLTVRGFLVPLSQPLTVQIG